MNSSFPRPLTASTRCAGNRLLASLPLVTWLHLSAHLQEVELAAGECLHEAGSVPRHVYFPTTAILSLVSAMRDGSSAEVAVIGSEGIVGVCTCMGRTYAHDTAVVQAAGLAWRMRVSTFVQQTWQSEELMRPVLRYGQALMTHISQTSACNRHHGIEQRLCRWMLAILDRQPSQEVRVTHERIAAMLGVRREGVTMAVRKLQRAGLLSDENGRGRINVLDRSGLEAGTCECHAVIRAAYDELLDDTDVSVPQPIPSRPRANVAYSPATWR